MRHAIALVPGFLGFDRVGSWTYWADRFISALRAQVEAQSGSSVPVVPVPSPPVGSLAARQKTLRQSLATLDAKMGGPFAWHLVGHSTGGLDAAFLARKNTLVDGRTGSVFGPDTLHVESLASVTTIAAPHYGSCLALAPIAELKLPRVTVAALGQLAQVGFAVFARGESKFLPRVKFAVGSALEGSMLQFLVTLLTNDELARDLAPRVAAALTMTPDNRRLDIPIFSIATVVPQPMRDQSDQLFVKLWTFTRDRSVDVHPAPPAIPWSPERVIATDASRVPTSLAAWDNDGVVNTARQVDLDGPNATFAGAVLGDHGDVIGLYDRTDPATGRLIEPGLLTSGADFGDDQFFDLVGLVARGIVSALHRA
jgi:hypothetical protein